MKINPILLLAVVFALTFSMASAQKKSKEDKNLEKEWKKKLKDLKPLDYKKLVDDQVALRSENQELNAKVTDIESQLVTKNNDLDKLKSENRNLEEEVK
ncbi:MAG: hypothetical protein H7Y04_00370, partial [Verrucomicrobia bacterium]|nr:hypothetical protein [Cytophagales bacterium]